MKGYKLTFVDNGSKNDELTYIGGKSFLPNNIMEEIREYRWGMVFRYINKKLVDIDFSLNVELVINGIEIFTEKYLIEKLKEYDIPTEESKGGYMNFYKLGISIGGFGKRRIPEKRLVCAFCEERREFYETILKIG